MKPAILLCEGQGSVVPGKGKDLHERSLVFREAFGEVQALTDIDLASISWGGDRFRTKADPHLAHVYSFAHQYAQFRSLQARGIEIGAATGHSLGELLALVFSGAIGLEQGFSFIDLRGRLFKRNVSESASDMIALIGPEAVIREVASMLDAEAGFHFANFNAPTQIVAAVRSSAIPELSSRFQARGIRVVPLHLGNGCHSPHVAAIEAPLAEAIASLEIARPAIPFFSASFGTFLDDPAAIRRALTEHLLAPVDWRGSAARLLATGAPMIELGYAKVLKAMVLELERSADVKTFESLAGKPDLVDA